MAPLTAPLSLRLAPAKGVHVLRLSLTALHRIPAPHAGRAAAAPACRGLIGSLLAGSGLRQPGRTVDRQKTSHAARTRRQEVRCRAEAGGGAGSGEGVRVRFAPSPTGNLHVGGARTALFNWLFARNAGGTFVLRIEDTDLERSTRESEAAVLRDLAWLGLDWDEGPEKGGGCGPYRQSERNEIYKGYARQLVAAGRAYPCFCTDEELEATRAEQEAKKLAPKYAGKWASATQAEVDAELARGTPHTYRFRVPQDRRIVIQDLIRGEVAWNTDTLGDFIILRSNGQPVYNFCVAVDDATMRISHVIRAEEHLPNTLRQALIYEALEFPMPQFGHVSLILAPDRSKLSKRHGATSVGQFKEMGFLPEAMVNYLALLGWNDGTEDEIFSPATLVEKFGISRITKSAAIFDKTKLQWVNGQHLRRKDAAELASMLGQQWAAAGLVRAADAPFVPEAAGIVQNSIDLLADGDEALLRLLHYPLLDTIASPEAAEVVADNLDEVAAALAASFDEGGLHAAIEGGHDAWKKWATSIGKPLKRKGKRLFMPIRILLTGSMQGPDVGATLALIRSAEASEAVTEAAALVPLSARIEALRTVDWPNVKAAAAAASNGATARTPEVAVASAH